MIVIPAGWSIAGCEDDDDEEDAAVSPNITGADAGAPADAASAPTGSLTFTSSQDAGHTHNVTLTVASLASPPSGGLSRETSLDAGHTHTVALTAAEMTAIDGGATVTKTTSVTGDHAHTFRFSKASGLPS